MSGPADARRRLLTAFDAGLAEMERATMAQREVSAATAEAFATSPVGRDEDIADDLRFMVERLDAMIEILRGTRAELARRGAAS